MPKKISQKKKKVSKKGATAISTVNVIIDKKPRAKKVSQNVKIPTQLPYQQIQYQQPQNQNISVADMIKILHEMKPLEPVQKNLSIPDTKNILPNKKYMPIPLQNNIENEEPDIPDMVKLSKVLPNIVDTNLSYPVLKHIPIPISKPTTTNEDINTNAEETISEITQSTKIPKYQKPKKIINKDLGNEKIDLGNEKIDIRDYFK